MNKKEKQNRGGFLGKGLFRLLSIVLILFFLVTAGLGIGRIRERITEDRYSYYEEADYLRNLRNEKYQDLLDMTLDDSGAHRVYEGDIPQCRAIGMYYDAALLCHAYEKAGSAEKAAFQKKRMERFAAQAGDYQEYIEKIDALISSYE